MNNSIKGALLSGLVFPGLGQFVLKHYKRGIAFMLAILVGLSVIIVKASQQALAIVEKIQSEGGAIDMNTISKAATQASTTSESLTFNLVLLLIIVCWIIGIVDAYRLGRKKDIEERSASQASIGNGVGPSKY
jgi:beta-lactamase regulating signal transducer with metallopeptidase domain